MLEFHHCPAAASPADLTLAGDAVLLYGCRSALHVRGDHWLAVAPPGHLVWLPAGQGRYRVASRDPLRAVTLHGNAASRARADPAVFDGRALLGALVRRLQELSAAPPRVGHAEFLAVLLHELGATRALASSVVLPRDMRLQAICSRVEAAMDRDINADAWAADFSLSTRTLQRLFVAECGIPTACWIRRRRLIEALALIEGGAPLADVARRTGYRSLSAFCAMFRQALGEPPRRFHVRAASA